MKNLFFLSMVIVLFMGATTRSQNKEIAPKPVIKNLIEDSLIERDRQLMKLDSLMRDL